MQWDNIAAKAWFIVSILLLLAVPITLAYMGLNLLAVLFVLPLAAWIAARVIIKGTGEAFTWLSRKPLEAWEGAYYAFNDVQVRVYEDEDELWFVVDDVVQATGLGRLPQSYLATHPRSAKEMGGRKAMNPAALEEMLGKRTDHESVRFLQWMRREVVRPWERKRERA